MEEACLLGTGDSLTASPRIASLLGFFGVEHRQATVEELSVDAANINGASGSCRVFCSPGELVQLVESGWEPCRIHSIFVHSGQDIGSITELLRTVSTEASDLLLRETTDPSPAWEIADPADGFGGSLRGLHVTPSGRADPPWRVAEIGPGAGIPLLFAGRQAFFFRLEWKDIPIFISLAGSVIDIDAELTTPNFDLRDHFFTALPVVSYIRWAFPETSWHSVEAGACLIIDDPLLWPRYGFLRFGELLRLMKRHNFTTNVAFIPWNWRRNHRKTVELFKQNRDRYSLSLHGGEHTAAEFGTTDSDALRTKITTARRRMAAHQRASGLQHDPIMVFPQGVFSEEAIVGLKQANFRAAINTEVKSSGHSKRRVKIRDVWETAIMLYADFPIYTRRYPRQGVENQAFDLMLGKPCFIVIHHDHCVDHCEKLVAFIDRLNSLRCKLNWRSADEVVKRSYRQRMSADGVIEIQMYGSEILLENRASVAKRFRIQKEESDPSAIKEVRLGATQVATDFADDFLHFDVELPAGEAASITLRFRDAVQVVANGHAQSSDFKIRLRRYLSELRDFFLPRRNLAARLFPAEHARN